MSQTPSDPTNSRSSPEEDLELARKAAAGDEAAREAVSRLVHPLIQTKTNELCKKFCNGNSYRYRCTLDPKWGPQDEDAALCDWGNHSYAWMLWDLTNPNRLMTYKGKRGAKLLTYLQSIARSKPFEERWKDDRLDRRIRVPEYIRKISPLAVKVFWCLVDRHSVETMAQKEQVAIERIEDIADRIIVELSNRGKLYLLDMPKTTSLTMPGSEDDPEMEDYVGDIPDYSSDPAKEEALRLLAEAQKKLTPVEKSVVDEMIGEGKTALKVLRGLKKLRFSIKEGVAPEKTDQQQLFYFKRKTIIKLRQLMGLDSDEGENG